MTKLPGHIEEHERAKQLGMHLDTLRKMRKRGEGQAYVVVGRQIHYVDADEPRWLASLKVTPPRREFQGERGRRTQKGAPSPSLSAEAAAG
jgi:hypothetical protein